MKQHKREYFFIVNTVAGRGKTGKKLNLLMSELNRRKLNYEIEITKYPLHAIELASSAIKKGFRNIIAVGGDGTINEVVNGIINSGKQNKVKLGIIPEGGGNDFAKNFKIGNKIKEDIEIILRGTTRCIDVGSIENKYFINALGIGFDASVAQYAAGINYLNGLPRYFLALIKAALKLKNHHLFLKVNGRLLDLSTLLVSVGNGLSTGGGFLLTPEAKVDDGKFDVCIIKAVTLGRIPKILTKVLKASHQSLPEVEIIQTDKIEICSDKVVPIYYDGELPELKDPYNIKIQLHPKMINLIC